MVLNNEEDNANEMTMPMEKTMLMTMKWMSNMKNSGYLLLPITDLFFKLEDLILQNLQRESFS